MECGHGLGHYKPAEVNGAGWKSMTDTCSLLYGLQVKVVKTFMPEDKKVSNVTLVYVQTPIEEVRDAACTNKVGVFFATLFFLHAKWRGLLNNITAESE